MFIMLFLISTSISVSDIDSNTFIDEHQNCEFWASAGKLSWSIWHLDFCDNYTDDVEEDDDNDESFQSMMIDIIIHSFIHSFIDYRWMYKES